MGECLPCSAFRGQLDLRLDLYLYGNKLFKGNMLMSLHIPMSECLGVCVCVCVCVFVCAFVCVHAYAFVQAFMCVEKKGEERLIKRLY